MISKNNKLSKNETLTTAGRAKNSSMTNGEQTSFAGVPWRKVLKVSLDRSFALLFSRSWSIHRESG